VTPPTEKPAPPRSPLLIENWISLPGIVLAASSFFAVAFLVAIDFTRGFGNPYLGILTYLVAPAFLVTGLALIVGGVVVERRRRRREAPGEVPKHPRIDFNVPRQRRAFLVTSVLAVVFFLVTAFGSYQTYHFTESVDFCGKTCHTVMQPEFTAYRNSPHARVACVQCHIGPGASWFVKSKLSGTYQVYATLFAKYPQPIPTPIKNLRPAQQTCEQCHWPQAFYGNAERVNYHYLPDSANSPRTIRLLMKVGGGDPSRGPVGGIHWHMNIADQVEYIAADSARQVIPWVRITDRNGNATVYRADNDTLVDALADSVPPRRMDCIDCHNRPSHIYYPPSQAVNLAMSTGRISTTLPFIKQHAVEVLTAPYDSTALGIDSIAAHLTTAYRDWSDTAAVHQAIAAVQGIYRNNFFPEMKVDWRVYPNNIGHTVFPGCYRCHDGKHRSADGRVITHECTACHIIIGQGGAAESRLIGPEGLDFQHPVDIGQMWRAVPCTACHTGATP